MGILPSQQRDGEEKERKNDKLGRWNHRSPVSILGSLKLTGTKLRKDKEPRPEKELNRRDTGAKADADSSVPRMDMLEGESQLPSLSSDFHMPAIPMHAKIIIIHK